jgi:1,2-diacylglycerol 3-alpha-glucosyltransferase
MNISSMIISVCFTNFGPYHLARLRALAARLQACGSYLIAYEVAGSERTYPWQRQEQAESFAWITLFPDRPLETLTTSDCARAMVQALDRDQPDVVGIVGYARSESIAAARWARRNGYPAVLLSESQAIDRPRSWWKESIKRRRLSLFDAALVGGPSHRDYLIDLGMPGDRVAQGYNAVDNTFYRNRANAWRCSPEGRQNLPTSPFFLSVCRFVPEKNLVRLIKAFTRYRDQVCPPQRWDLVLCGDGSQSGLIEETIVLSGHSEAIHRPGFLQADTLCRWYAQAAAFVLPSLSEPWGLVVNEAASAGLPLLVSERAGCAQTLVPDPEGTTGARLDPLDVEGMAKKLTWMALLSQEERLAMGQRAVELVSHWGPDRFARGMLEAIELAVHSPRNLKMSSL